MSQLGLVWSIGLRLGLVMFLGLSLRVKVSVSISGGSDKMVLFTTAMVIFDAIVVAFTAAKALCFRNSALDTHMKCR